VTPSTEWAHGPTCRPQPDVRPDRAKGMHHDDEMQLKPDLGASKELGAPCEGSADRSLAWALRRDRDRHCAIGSRLPYARWRSGGNRTRANCGATGVSLHAGAFTAGQNNNAPSGVDRAWYGFGIVDAVSPCTSRWAEATKAPEVGVFAQPNRLPSDGQVMNSQKAVARAFVLILLSATPACNVEGIMDGSEHGMGFSEGDDWDVPMGGRRTCTTFWEECHEDYERCKDDCWARAIYGDTDASTSTRACGAGLSQFRTRLCRATCRP